MSDWITDYTQVDEAGAYIVLAIAPKQDGTGTFLYDPNIRTGWQLKRLTPGCYAAILMPAWNTVKPVDCPEEPSKELD